ncbi:hypothetical protein AZE42_06387 [Rhizopogon vesiculosus]|uniref:Uncharacterized protein n=1 Tax=Rhizopogon vesiculosus TaxID=180088 RepID=A0A1J8R9I2_9AGAM|nr:hypothetical protein AZE42_06387 [Rhizopogon vesiculosus]
MFWNTPATSARTLRFTDKLMDEEVDINDVSVMSFTSPVSRPRSVLSSLGLPVDEDSFDNGLPVDEDSFDNCERGTRPDESVMPDPPDKEVVAEECNEQVPILAESHTPSETETPLPAHPELPIHAAVPPGSARKPKVRMNSEIERIVTKIWSTVGEIIMPGHPFDPTGSVSGGSKPPRAKETLYVRSNLSSPLH